MKYNHTPFLRNIVLCSIFIISNFVIISTVTAGSAVQNLTFRMGMNRVCDSSNHCLNVQATDANTGGQVSILQDFLTKNGYIPKDVRTNGNFGYYTEKGLKLYQADNGIVGSGETGPNTRVLLNEADRNIENKSGDRYKTSEPFGNAMNTKEDGNSANVKSVNLQTVTVTGKREFTDSDVAHAKIDKTLDAYNKSNAVKPEDADRAAGLIPNLDDKGNPVSSAPTGSIVNGVVEKIISWGPFGEPIYDYRDANDFRAAQVNDSPTTRQIDANSVGDKQAQDQLTQQRVNSQPLSPLAAQNVSGSAVTGVKADSQSQMVGASNSISDQECALSRTCSTLGKTIYSILFPKQQPAPVEDRKSYDPNCGAGGWCIKAPDTPAPSQEPEKPADPQTPSQNSSPTESPKGGDSPNREDPTPPQNSSPTDSPNGENGTNGYIDPGSGSGGNENTNTNAYDRGQGEGSGGDMQGCFVAGTKILMADSSLKNIEDVKKGDYVMTEKGPSVVEAHIVHAYNGNMYAYNNSEKYFFTPNHPFMTTSGWRSINPEVSMSESPDVVIEKTKVGDILVKISSQEKITSIQKKHVKTTVYNLTVAKTHSYYADDYLVHNIGTTVESSGEGNWWSFW